VSATVGDLSAAESPLMHIDPEKPTIVSAWGRKGSGKSVLNRELFRSWPFDRLVIDVNGNADPGPDAERLTAPLPTRFPDGAGLVGERRKARSLWFRAHPGDKAYREQLDQAVGVALYPQHKRTCLWAGEVGELMPNGRTGPHMRTALMQNRHHNLTLLVDGPRPMYVDPLVLAQSDLVAVFELPNPRDRDRIADSIGFPPRRFTEACHSAWRQGEHWFVLWDAARKRLFEHEPLPLDEAA
jgi:hypothetical protein